MITLKTTSALQHYVYYNRNQYKTIGLVPTMGALHDGHMELIKQSTKENNRTICSVFVNPTQFNEISDIENYPRTLTADSILLKKNNADVLFSPSIKDIYPYGMNQKIQVDLEGLDQQLEGKFRPGHFEGVIQIVHKLLSICLPDKLYMGQKDFQQFSIIQKMIENLNMNVDLRVVPIIRDKDGLAKSSRNVRLSRVERKLAPIIFQTLTEIREMFDDLSVLEIEKSALNRLSSIEGFRPEYFTLIKGYNLQPIEDISQHEYIVACTAVWVGQVRLIDNMVYKKPKNLHIFTN